MFQFTIRTYILRSRQTNDENLYVKFFLAFKYYVFTCNNPQMKKKWLHAIRNSGNVMVNRSRLNCETANNEIRKQRQLVILELIIGSLSKNDGDSYKTSLKREFALLQTL